MRHMTHRPIVDSAVSLGLRNIETGAAAKFRERPAKSQADPSLSESEAVPSRRETPDLPALLLPSSLLPSASPQPSRPLPGQLRLEPSPSQKRSSERHLC